MGGDNGIEQLRRWLARRMGEEDGGARRVTAMVDRGDGEATTMMGKRRRWMARQHLEPTRWCVQQAAVGGDGSYGGGFGEEATGSMGRGSPWKWVYEPSSQSMVDRLP